MPRSTQRVRHVDFEVVGVLDDNSTADWETFEQICVRRVIEMVV